MRPKWKILSLFFWLSLLSACGGTELEKRCFPMALVADEKQGLVEMSYVFPQLSQKENTDIKKAKVDAVTEGGVTFEEALLRYEKQLDKKVDGNHMKVMILGEQLMEAKALLYPTLDYIRNHNLIPRNTYVCVTDYTEELLKIQEELPTDLGSYLENYLEKIIQCGETIGFPEKTIQGGVSMFLRKQERK